MSHSLPCNASISLTFEQLGARQDPAAVNPFSGQPWSPDYAVIHDGRTKLPAYPGMKDVLEGLRDPKCQVLVVDSPTGSGKTTQVPQVCAHALAHAGCKGQVWLTQPRIIAARECASRLATEMDVDLGDVVGLETRQEVVMPDDPTCARVIVMTDGMMLNKAGADSMASAGIVLVDEFHERGINMDFAIIRLGIALAERPDLKVILMSATADTSVPMQYLARYNPRLIKLEGRPKKITIQYVTAPKDWVKSTLQVIYDIVCETRGDETRVDGISYDGDILVFCPGQYDVVKLFEGLQTSANDFPADFRLVEVHMLFRDLGHAEQQQVFERHFADEEGEHPLRKIILATNIAETSLTFNGLVHVIDCCMNKVNHYCPSTDSHELVTVPCTKPSAGQRAGRVGRNCPGLVTRVLSRDTYDELPDTNSMVPILVSDLTSAMLKFCEVGLPEGGWRAVEWVAEPQWDVLQRGIDNLRVLGFLEPDGETITDMGRWASQLSLDPSLAKMFMDAKGTDIEEEVLELIAILDAGSLSAMTAFESDQAKTARRPYQHPLGDALSQFNLWHHWNRRGGEDSDMAFCRQSYIRHTACVSVNRRWLELKSLWEQLYGQPPIASSPEQHVDLGNRLALQILRAFPHHLCALVVDKPTKTPRWRNVRLSNDKWEGSDLYRPPNSCIPSTHRPRYVVYTSLSKDPSTAQLSMVNMTIIQDDMMRKFDPNFDNGFHRFPGKVGVVPGAEPAGPSRKMARRR